MRNFFDFSAILLIIIAFFTILILYLGFLQHRYVLKTKDFVGIVTNECLWNAVKYLTVIN